MIRKISPEGEVSTFAGSPRSSANSNNDGTGTNAYINNPQGITIDEADNLYFVEPFSVRKITPAGVVTTLAGSHSEYGSADGVGPSAPFQQAYGIVGMHEIGT